MSKISLIERALSLRSLYHKLIASNIANVNTPNYKKKEIDLASEIKREKNAKIFEVTETKQGFYAPDGNTVDLEEEVTKLTENTLMYNALIQIVVKRFSIIRYLINEGKR